MAPSDIDILVSDGLRFLRSITDYYGHERGMEVWEAMGEAMGKEVKGKVFFAMLTGKTPNRVTFRRPPNMKVASFGSSSGIPVVQVIKLIREYTGLGLKEAKDKWDQCIDFAVSVEVKDGEAHSFERKLRDFGMIVE